MKLAIHHRAPVRRALVTGALSALALLGLCNPLLAQTYPARPITIIMTAAPGDGSDVAVRLMQVDLRKALNVPIVLVNRPGAGGVLAVDNVVQGPKDGYTLLFTNNAPLTFRPVTTPETTRYDPLTDLVPLGMVSRSPFLFAVRSDVPVNSFAQLVTHVKQNPAALRVATVGSGSVGDFTAYAIGSLIGTPFTTVPYKGASPAVMAVTGGQVESTAITMSALIAHIRSGAIRPLVISSKYPAFPTIPTLSELGYSGNLIGVWTGFFAPAGIPDDARNALVPAFRAALTNPAFTAKLAAGGLVASYAGPDEVRKEIAQEYRMVKEFATKAGLVK